LLFKYFYFIVSVPLSFKDTVTPCIIKEKLLARYAKSNIEITDKEIDLEINFINEKISLEKNPTPEWLDDLINSLVLSKEEALKIAKSLVEQETWNFASLYSALDTLKQLVLTYPTLSITIAATFITIGIYCSGYGNIITDFSSMIYKLWSSRHDLPPMHPDFVNATTEIKKQIAEMHSAQRLSRVSLENLRVMVWEISEECNGKAHQFLVSIDTQNKFHEYDIDDKLDLLVASIKSFRKK